MFQEKDHTGKNKTSALSSSILPRFSREKHFGGSALLLFYDNRLYSKAGRKENQKVCTITMVA